MLLLCQTTICKAENLDIEALTQQATQLLLQGQENEAAQLLSRLRLHPNPPLQVLFLSGQIAGNRGQWDMAIRYYRIMLESNPALLRPRLELARALYMNHEFDAATHHFNLVLGEPMLPAEVRSNVMTYINQISHQTFSHSLTIEFSNDSNINQATANPILMIGNQPFMLSGNALQQSGAGFGLTWQGQYRFGEARQFSLRGVVQHKDFAGKSFDLSYAQTYLGVTQQWNPTHSTLIESGGHIAIYAGRKLYDGFAFRVADTWRSQNGLTLSTTLDSKQMQYPDFSYRNSWQHGISLDVTQALAAGISLTGGINYARNLAQESTYSFVSNGAKLAGMIELPWHTVGNVSMEYQHTRYDGPDPFFGLPRQENRAGVEVGLMPVTWAWQGFAPRFVLGHANNRANIALYDYRKNYVKVIFTREF